MDYGRATIQYNRYNCISYKILNTTNIFFNQLALR